MMPRILGVILSALVLTACGGIPSNPVTDFIYDLLSPPPPSARCVNSLSPNGLINAPDALQMVLTGQDVPSFTDGHGQPAARRSGPALLPINSNSLSLRVTANTN
jgi:hypothetical protein